MQQIKITNHPLKPKSHIGYILIESTSKPLEIHHSENMGPVIKIDKQMLGVYDNVEPKTRKFLKKKILNYALNSKLWEEPIIIDDNLIENIINL